MGRTIFTVDSDSFSKELMNYYLEKELDLQPHNFFNVDEMMSYFKLEPDIIIYDSESTSFSENHLKTISERFSKTPIFLSINLYNLHFEELRENKLFTVRTFPLNNIYFSTVEVCFQLMEYSKNNIDA